MGDVGDSVGRPHDSAGSAKHRTRRGKTSRWTLGRLLLVMGGIGCLGVVVLVAGVVAWAHFHGRAFVDQTKAADEEGRSFGRRHSAERCVDEGLTRVDACPAWNLKCRFNVQLFVQGCLTESQDLAVFCADVPKPLDFTDSYAYQNDTCRDRGQALEQSCLQLMASVQQQCDRLRNRAPAR